MSAPFHLSVTWAAADTPKRPTSGHDADTANGFSAGPDGPGSATAAMPEASRSFGADAGVAAPGTLSHDAAGPADALFFVVNAQTASPDPPAGAAKAPSLAQEVRRRPLPPPPGPRPAPPQPPSGPGAGAGQSVPCNEKPPTDAVDQEYPRLVPQVRVNRPLEAEGYTPASGWSKSVFGVALAVGRRNVVHYVWQETLIPPSPGAPAQGRVYYVNNDPATRRFNGFSLPVLVIPTYTPPLGPTPLSFSMVVDRTDTVHLVWEEGGSLRYWRRQPNGTTSLSTVRLAESTPTQNTWYTHPQLALYAGPTSDRVDFAFLKHVTSTSTFESIRYVAGNPASPGDEEVFSTFAVPSIPLYDHPTAVAKLVVYPYVNAAQPGGVPVVAWERSFSAPPGYVDVSGLQVSRRSAAPPAAGTWTPHVLVSPSGWNYDMAVTPDHRLHFTYSASLSPGGPVALRYRSLTASGARTDPETPDATMVYGLVVGDSRGNPRILADTTMQYIKSYFMKIGDSWHKRVNLWEDGLTNLTHPRVVIGPDDTVYLAGPSFVPSALYDSKAVFAQLDEPNLGTQDDQAMHAAGPATTNAVVGNLHFTLPLFKAVAGRGPELSFSLVYNSQQTGPSLISPGWRHNYQVELTDHDIAPANSPSFQGRITVRFGNGRRTVFQYRPNHQRWIGEDEYGHFSSITRIPLSGSGSSIEQPTYALLTKAGTHYHFDQYGRLVTIQDRHGQGTAQNLMHFQYTNGRLTTIRDSVSRTASLQYLPDGRLQTVTDPSNQIYILFYNAQNQLDRVRLLAALPPTGIPVMWGFTYWAAQPLLKNIVTPKNFGTINAYFYEYCHGRVVRMTDPDNQVKTFGYFDAAFQTQVVDRRGMPTLLDWKYRASTVWKNTDALGNFVQRTWTPFRGVTQQRDKRGWFTCSAHGEYTGDPNTPPQWVLNNVESVVRPGNGSHCAHPTMTAYNPFSQSLWITDSLTNKTCYEYDATGVNLSTTRFPVPSGTPACQGPFEQRTYDGSPYSSYGRLRTVRDPRGSVTTHDYGGLFGGSDPGTGLVTSILHAGHTQRELFTYDIMGRVTQHRTPEGTLTVTQYNPLGWVTRRTLPPEDTGQMPPVIDSEYDANGNVIKTVGPRPNEITRYEYDAQNRLRRIVNPLHGVGGLNGITERWYDAESNLILEVRPNGDWSWFAYDELGRLAREEHSAWPDPNLVKTYTYDENGNVLTETLPDLPTGGAVVTRHFYDERNNRFLTIYPDYSYDLMTYNANDQLLTRLRYGANGFHSGVKNTYDERGFLKTVTEVTNASSLTGPTTTNFYDPAGNLIKVRDPLGWERETRYDAANRPYQTFDAFGVQQSLVEYDDDNRKTREWHQNPVTNNGTLVPLIRYTYTPAGKVKTVQRGWNGGTFTTTFTNFYDPAGNLIKTVDEENNVRELEYDLLNRLTREKIYVAPGLVREVRRKYDSAGNLTELTDGRGKVTYFIYNDAKKLNWMIYAGLSAFEGWTYTAHGWTETYTNANGLLTSYVYDPNGRVIVEASASFPATVRAYDAGGNVLAAERGTIRTVFTYDRQNRLTETRWLVAGTAWKSVAYTYRDDDQRATMTDPEGVGYVYNYNRDRLTGIVRAGVPEAAFTYDTGNRRKTLTYGNGATTAYTYDVQARLLDLETRDTATPSQTLAKFAYAYNKADQRTSVTLGHHSRRIDYVYNGAYELLSETHVHTGTSARLYVAGYQYDAAGNRLAKQTAAGHSTYAYADDNRLLEERQYTTAVSAAASATASSTAAGYTSGRAIDGNTADGTSASEAWASTVAAGVHTLTASLAAAQNIAGVRLWVPSTKLPQAFRIRVGAQEIGTALPTYTVVGAMEVSPGVFKALQREITFAFPAVSAGAVSFVQDAGGGAASSPNQAFVNELQILTAATSGLVTYSYDFAGNQTGRQEGNTSESWTYDESQRVETYRRVVSGQVQTTFVYGYDAGGKRMYKQEHDANWTPGRAWWYAYEGDDVIADYVKDVGQPYQLETSYINSMAIDAKIGRVQGSNKTYYLNDVLNTNSRMLNAAQAVIRDEISNAYGEVLSSSGVQDRYGFTGREKNDESGLMHFRARAYDPRLGRFIQRDPIQSNQAIEHYVYVSNRPVSLVDPSGLYEEDVHYYMVYALARLQGFQPDEAHTIAGASQYVDDNKLTQPITRHLSVKETFHFGVEKKGGMEAVKRGSEFARDLFNEGVAKGNAERTTLLIIGAGLHKLADSYAHEGFVAGLGHSLESLSGIPVDDPEARPNLAMAMAKDVFESLGAYRQALGREGPGITWESVQDDIRENFQVEERGNPARIKGQLAAGKGLDKKDFELLMEKGVPVPDKLARIRQWQRYIDKIDDKIRPGIGLGAGYYDKSRFAANHKQDFEKWAKEKLEEYERK